MAGCGKALGFWEQRQALTSLAKSLRRRLNHPTPCLRRGNVVRGTPIYRSVTSYGQAFISVLA